MPHVLTAEQRAEKAKRPITSKRGIKIMARHRVLLDEMQKPEHKGNMTAAIIAAGFSPVTANNAGVITKTKSWQALMQEQLPDNFIVSRHRELLDKRDRIEVVIRDKRGREIARRRVDDGVNVPAVSKGLEMAYKLKGRFMPESLPNSPAVAVYNLFYKPEVRATLTAFEAQLEEAIRNEVKHDEVSPKVYEAEAEPDANAGSVAASG